MKRMIWSCLSLMLLAGGCDYFRLENQNQANQSDFPSVDEFNRAIEQGRFEFVILEGEKYVRHFPNSPAVWHDLGWAYTKTDRLTEGKRCFQKALRLNPKEDNSYVGLGTIARRRGENDEARKMYAKAISMRPDNGTALASLLVIDLMEKKFAAAIDSGEKAWSFNKQNPVIPANLSVAYHYQGNTKKRDFYYKKAESMGYQATDRLQDIFSGKLTLFPEDEEAPASEKQESADSTSPKSVANPKPATQTNPSKESTPSKGSKGKQEK